MLHAGPAHVGREGIQVRPTPSFVFVESPSLFFPAGVVVRAQCTGARKT